MIVPCTPAHPQLDSFCPSDGQNLNSRTTMPWAAHLENGLILMSCPAGSLLRSSLDTPWPIMFHLDLALGPTLSLTKTTTRPPGDLTLALSSTPSTRQPTTVSAARRGRQLFDARPYLTANPTSPTKGPLGAGGFSETDTRYLPALPLSDCSCSAGFSYVTIANTS